MNIKGNIIIGADLQSFSGATVNIFLEDVGRIDAPAKIIHKQILPNISHIHGQVDNIDFHFDVDEPVNSKASLILRVHIDKIGNGNVDKGDLITMQSYPVRVSDDKKIHQIKVKEVQ